MKGFYLTLPSNSSMDFFPDNLTSHYVTHLPNPIHLSGQWEVGLVEILYPHTWYNFTEDQDEMAIYTSPDSGPTEELPFHVPAGYYDTVEKLLKRIEDEAWLAMNLTGNKPVRLRYDDITRKITADLYGCSLHVGEKAQQLLGMAIPALPEGTTQGAAVVDMNPLHSLYVYCDLVAPRVVGNTLVPLLRVVPVEGHHGAMVCKTYENVHYVDVQHREFQTVEINIRDDTGKKVPFESGKSTVTLHFRRKATLL